MRTGLTPSFGEHLGAGPTVQAALANHLIVAATETNTEDDMDRFARALEKLAAGRLEFDFVDIFGLPFYDDALWNDPPAEVIARCAPDIVALQELDVSRPRSGGVDQARAIADAAKMIFPDSALLPSQEVHVTLVPSLTRANRVEPVRFSVFGEGHDHKVTIARDAAGEFVASASPIDERVVRAPIVDDDQPRASSLYTSLHYTAERQGVVGRIRLECAPATEAVLWCGPQHRKRRQPHDYGDRACRHW